MAFCSTCGNQIPENSEFCPSCGAAVHATVRAAAPTGVAPVAPSAGHPKKALCIIALIMGISSLALGALYGTGIPFAIVGLILGGKALKVAPDKMAKAGKTMSVIGLILGIIILVIEVIVLVISAASYY